MNRQMLLAMENHDDVAQIELTEQLSELQEEIEQMCSNRNFLSRPPPGNIG